MMKTKTQKIISIGTILTLSSLPLTAVMNLTSVSWSAGSIQNFGGNIYTGSPGPPSGTASYAGFQDQGSGQYVFGFIKNAGGDMSQPATFDVTGKDAATGDFTLNFDLGSTTRLSHVAYTGSQLKGYNYAVSAGGLASLSITMSATSVAESATTGTANTTMLGISLSTYELASGSTNLGASVFRSNMWWGDISPLDTSAAYGASSFKSLEQYGANFDGKNGVAVDFNFYAALDVLRDNVNISSLDDMQMAINKAGDVTLTPGVGITYYTNGVDPLDPRGVAATYLDKGTDGGSSTYNFGAAGGEDNYVDASFTNSVWSDGNVGFSSSPVPEPSSTALLGLGSLGLLLRRRR